MPIEVSIGLDGLNINRSSTGKHTFISLSANSVKKRHPS